VRTLPVSEGTDRKPFQTSVGNEAKQSKCEKSERTQIFPSDIKFSSQTTGNAQILLMVDYAVMFSWEVFLVVHLIFPLFSHLSENP
jgi:hypothetical protein